MFYVEPDTDWIPFLPPFLFGLIILPSRSLKARLFSPIVPCLFILLRTFVSFLFQCLNKIYHLVFCCCYSCCKPVKWEKEMDEILYKLEENSIATEEEGEEVKEQKFNFQKCFSYLDCLRDYWIEPSPYHCLASFVPIFLWMASIVFSIVLMAVLF